MITEYEKMKASKHMGIKQHIKNKLLSMILIWSIILAASISYCYLIAKPVYGRTVLLMMPIHLSNDRDINTLVQEINSRKSNIDIRAKLIRNSNLIQLDYESENHDTLNEYSDENINEIIQKSNRLDEEKYKDMILKNILEIKSRTDEIKDIEEIQKAIEEGSKRGVHEAQVVSDDNHGGEAIKPKKAVIIIAAFIVGTFFAVLWGFLSYIWLTSKKENEIV